MSALLESQLSLDLTVEEVDTLRRCEAIIEEGRATFIKVGNALIEIKEGNLFRATHPTFEAYLQDRWQIGTKHAYRLIQAAEVVADLSSGGESGIPAPTAESHVRPLATLDTPGERREAWTKANQAAAADNRPMVAADVQAEVAKVKPPVQKKPVPVETPAVSEAAAPAVAPEPAPLAEAPSAPAPVPAPAVEKPAEPTPGAAPVGGFVTALMPRSEYDWLLSNSLTVGVAIAELREFRDNPPVAAPAPDPVGIVLSQDALDALDAIINYNVGLGNASRTRAEQLEIMVISLARRAGLITDAE